MFIAIACSWQANAEAWPTQETIAAFCGYTPRAVQDFIQDLERGGFVRKRRQQSRAGGDRLYYAPGRTTLAALIAFMERYPHDWSGVRAGEEPEQEQPVLDDVTSEASEPQEAAAGSASETISGRVPEAISVKPREKLKEPSCWRAEPSTPEHVGREEEQAGPSELTGEDREIALTVLAERLKRKHPDRKAPRLFETTEIELVASCSRAVEGGRESKLQAHREALDGAYLVSKDGPPSVRFIWGKVEHFLDHAERGRRKLRAIERTERAERTRNEPSEAQAPRIVRVETPAMSEAQREFNRLFGGAGDFDAELARRTRGAQ